jgi:hypothetical protein
MLKEDLMEELCIRNLSTKGKKLELKIQLLEQGLKDKAHVKHHRHKSKRKNKKDKSSMGKGFPSTAKWEPLVPDTGQLAEPQNPTFQFPRALTIAKGDERVVLSKFNFSKCKFDMVSKEIKWVEKVIKVFNVDTEEKELLTFFQMGLLIFTIRPWVMLILLISSEEITNQMCG